MSLAFVGFSGDMAAFSCMLLPFATFRTPEISIFVTFAYTVTVAVAFLPLPSFARAVIVTFPGFDAVTMPFETVATDLLLLDQIT